MRHFCALPMLSNLGYLEIGCVKSTHFNTCLSFHKNHWEVIPATMMISIYLSSVELRILPETCIMAWTLHN